MSAYNKNRNKSEEYKKDRRTRWNKWRGTHKSDIKRNPTVEKQSKISSPRRFLTDLMSHAKRICSKKNLPFDIDLNFLENKWAIQNERCNITGIKMTYNRDDLFSVRIDAIDQNQGYTKNNTQLICDGVKRMKKGMTNEEVITLISEIKSVIMING